MRITAGTRATGGTLPTRNASTRATVPSCRTSTPRLVPTSVAPGFHLLSPERSTDHAWPPLRTDAARRSLSAIVPGRETRGANGSPRSFETGGDLLSQGLSSQVPSALEGLTSVFGMGTGGAPPLWPPRPRPRMDDRPCRTSLRARACVNSSPRPISTGQLNVLPRLHFRPINVVVYHGPYQVNPVGEFILEEASRLDAFSGYPFRRSLTSHALGRTTGTRELRPSRSSRTRDSFPQFTSGYRG